MCSRWPPWRWVAALGDRWQAWGPRPGPVAALSDSTGRHAVSWQGLVRWPTWKTRLAWHHTGRYPHSRLQGWACSPGSISGSSLPWSAPAGPFQPAQACDMAPVQADDCKLRDCLRRRLTKGP